MMLINNDISEGLSLKIRVLSFFAAFSVALLHFGQWIDEGDIWSAAIKDGVVRGFSFFSVSFFFVISAFLLARNYDGTKQWWLNMLHKRYHSLFCPYVFWCTLGGLVSVVSIGVAEGGWLSEIMRWYGIAVTSQNVLPRFFSMWYVRNLMVLCIVSPLLFWLIELVDRTRVGRMMSFIFVGVVVLVDFPLKDQLVMSTLYFSLGIWFAKNFDFTLKRGNMTAVSVALVVVLVLKCLTRYRGMAYGYQLHCLMVPIAIAFVWLVYDRMLQIDFVRVAVESRRAQEIWALSFPVYVLHTALLLYCPQPAEVFLKGCAYPFVMTMLSVAVAWCTSKVLMYISPCAFKFIMGGRG